MKKVLSLLLCIFIPCVAVWAQNKDEQVVANAVSKLNQAMIDANQMLLDELSSERLSYGHSSWLIEDKDAFITAIVDGKSGFTSIDLTEQSIAITNNVAIVRHKFSAGTDNKGQPPGHINLGVMQIWQKEKGKWMLLARQATRIP
ncbi:MAG: nuclear transport factor 2 family protein [Cyclobacteriaceae bacterium]